MPKLEGIVELRGKYIRLEKITNSILKKILHTRLRNDNFSFFHRDAPSYTEHTESREPYHDSYKDVYNKNHKDNHTESHSDNHKDKSNGYYDVGGSHPDYMESSHYGDHTDRGHSESVNYGYSEHTDFYS